MDSIIEGEETTSLVLSETKHHAVAKRSLFDLDPDAQIIYASKIATSLAAVVEKQQLYSIISGKKHVKVEGWSLLGTFLGILPKERSIIEHADGSFEASFDLIRQSDGTIVGGASALCGKDEKRWAGADRYARRSMAATRAVGKAYRTSFSWIISLAGYAPTPEEEMPKEAIEIPFDPGPKVSIAAKTRVAGIYTGSKEQQDKVLDYCLKNGVDIAMIDEVGKKLMGRSSTDLKKIVEDIKMDGVKF